MASVVIDRVWLEQRVAAKKALIVQYETALSLLAVTGVQSYQLDTGQTRQMVTRANVRDLREAVAALESELAVLEAQLNGAGFQVTPGF